jgi:ankyrin repeat protein
MEYIEAIKANDIAQIRSLIEAGMKPKDFEKLFLDSCEYGTPELVKAFLEEWAANKEMKSNGFTPLMSAIKGENLLVAQLLIERGAKLDAGTQNGTPLSIAVANNDLKSIQFLIEKGAQPDYKNGGSLLEDAVASNNVQLMNIAIDINKSSLQSAFTLACEKGNFQAIQLLVRRGAKVDFAGGLSNSPTLLVSYSGKELEAVIEMMNFLFENGAKREALAEYSVDTFKWLVEEKDADVNELQKKGSSGAVKNLENYFRAQGLIASELSGKSAVIRAMEEGNLEVVEYLIKKGADTSIRCDDGKTLYEVAHSRNDKNALKLLDSYGVGVEDKKRLEIQAQVESELESMKKVILPAWIPTIDRDIDEILPNSILLKIDFNYVPEDAQKFLGVNTGVLYLLNESIDSADDLKIVYAPADDFDETRFVQLYFPVQKWTQKNDRMTRKSPFPTNTKNHVRLEKLMGWPSWIQGEEYPVCDRCEKLMRLVYQKFINGDEEIHYIFHCENHTTDFKLVSQY